MLGRWSGGVAFDGCRFADGLIKCWASSLSPLGVTGVARDGIRDVMDGLCGYNIYMYIAACV